MWAVSRTNRRRGTPDPLGRLWDGGPGQGRCRPCRAARADCESTLLGHLVLASPAPAPGRSEKQTGLRATAHACDTEPKPRGALNLLQTIFPGTRENDPCVDVGEENDELSGFVQRPPHESVNSNKCLPKQGTAAPGLDSRPGALHRAKKKGESPGNRAVCRVSHTDFFGPTFFFELSFWPGEAVRDGQSLLARHAEVKRMV